LLTVDVAVSSAEFKASKPRLLFEKENLWNYEVIPEGRFIMILQEKKEAETPHHLNLVLNWFEEVKRRVPSGKK